MRTTSATSIAVAFSLCCGPALAQSDEEIAGALWRSLSEADFVGADSIVTRPYEGTEPHGQILQYLQGEVDVNGTAQRVIVKKNYGGEGATIERVWSGDRSALASVTVMLKRAGYGAANQDWYWAKFGPDGGTQQAGKVSGCIQCHQAAEGGDYIYSY